MATPDYEGSWEARSAGQLQEGRFWWRPAPVSRASMASHPPPGHSSHLRYVPPILGSVLTCHIAWSSLPNHMPMTPDISLSSPALPLEQQTHLGHGAKHWIQARPFVPFSPSPTLTPTPGPGSSTLKRSLPTAGTLHISHGLQTGLSASACPHNFTLSSCETWALIKALGPILFSFFSLFLSPTSSLPTSIPTDTPVTHMGIFPAFSEHQIQISTWMPQRRLGLHVSKFKLGCSPRHHPTTPALS